MAAAAICAIQVARRVSGLWGDVLVGLMIALAFGVKINAVLVALGLAWPLLQRQEWLRTTRIAAVALARVALEYIFYGLNALKPLLAGSSWSPCRSRGGASGDRDPGRRQQAHHRDDHQLLWVALISSPSRLPADRLRPAP